MASTSCAWLHGVLLVVVLAGTAPRDAAAAAADSAGPGAGADTDGTTAAGAGAAHQAVTIQAWGEHSLRIRAVPAGVEFSATPAVSALDWGPGSGVHAPVHTAVPGGPGATNGNIRAALDSSNRLVVTRASDGRELLAETKPRTITPREHDAGHSRWSNTSLFAVQASIAARADERLYGLGQHTAGTLDQRNQSLPFLPMNTEVFIPFVVSSHGYGYLINYPGAGNLAWSDGAAEWSLAAAAQFDIWVTTTAAGAETAWPAELLSHYVDATGHAPVLPEWATGLWQSKNRYQTQQELLDVVQGYRSRNLSLSVIVADYFTWSPEFTTGDYDFDSTCWPDVAKLVAQLREWGVELMVSTYGNFVSPHSKHYAGAAASGDLLATLPNGTVLQNGFQNSSVYDFYSAKARAHFWADFKRRYVDAYGIKVFWQDCDEWCSDSGGDSSTAVYPSVGTAQAVGSAYPAVLAQAYAEGFNRSGVADGIQLGRSAWAGSQRFGAAVWSGDIGSRWQDLAMSVSAGQSIGLSGIPWWTTDVGGYGGSHGRAMNTSDANARELMVRWVQFGAFCPLFRIHGFRAPNMSSVHTCPVCKSYSCDQSHETAAWAYGAEAEQAIAKMIRAREALRPYINAQMKAAADTGAPVMRPLWFEFPTDPRTMESTVETTQFLMGSDYMIAPVTTYLARERSGVCAKSVSLFLNFPFVS